MASAAETSNEVGWWQRLRELRRWRADSGDNVDGLVRSYADGLFVTARGLSKSPDDAFAAIGEQALYQARSPRPELRDVLSIELAMVQLLPPQDRARRYWEYRERFERVATASEHAAYLASNPPPHPQPGEAPDPSLDADLLVLLDHIHRSYILTVVREGAVRDLKKWVQRGLVRGGLIFLGLILLLLLWQDPSLLPPRFRIQDSIVAFAIGVITLFYLGRLGAAMSVIQRLQRAVREIDRDPFFEITALCTGRRGISIAMLSGGIFALLLYVVFAAGLGERLGMSGGIFPELGEESPANTPATRESPSAGSSQAVAGSISQDSRPVQTFVGPPAPSPGNATGAAVPSSQGTPAARAPKDNAASTGASANECRGKTDCMPEWVAEIGKHLGFRSYPDFFKMLLLAFLAGFAERLVPDAIDRLTRRQAMSDPETAAATVQAGRRS